MDCTEFSNLLDALMDGTLPEEDASRMRRHAAECPACAAMLTLRQDMKKLDAEIETPEAFSSSWREMVREEGAMEEKKKRSFPLRGWAAAAAVLIFVVGGTLANRNALPSRQSARQDAVMAEKSAGGGEMALRSSLAAGSASNFSYDTGALDDYAAEAYEGAGYEEMEADEAQRQEKIIRSASFTVKTTHYDADLERIQQLTEDHGGRVEYLSASGDASSGQNRSASLTLRIPAQRLDDFLAGVQTIGSVTAMTQEMEDVSDSYYDVATRLKTQQEKMNRLQAMIASAEDVSDLIEIESAIADTQYYIDRYTGQLKSYDSRVNYSTVQVSVRETKVTETKEVTLGERIAEGFTDSMRDFGWFLEDMAVFLVAALPWIASIAVLVIVVCVIVRKRKNKKQI